MSTALLALGLLIGLGVVAFLISLGLTGLGLLLSWIFPLTPFQGTLLNLVVFSIALIFIGVTFLFERMKDVLWAAPDEEGGSINGQAGFLERFGGGSGPQQSLTPRPEATKVGRNDPCPCGSGKKYKLCCLMKL